MISVVMPAYNAEKTIEDAILSVLNQTYTDFELLVVNDCSTDNTEKIIKKLADADERIRYLKNPINRGVSKTRNYAISEAKGEWIAFLDSDDMWREDKLEKQLEIAKEHNVVLIYTASSFINENGMKYSYIMQAEEMTDYSTLLKRNIISCSSVMVKADVMKKIEMPNDKMHEDYYVWLTILKDYKYAYGINEPMLIYRLSSNSKSSSRIKSSRMLYHSYRAVGYNAAVSFLLTLRYSVHSIKKRVKISRSSEEK